MTPEPKIAALSLKHITRLDFLHITYRQSIISYLFTFFMPLSSHLNVNFTKVQTLLSCPMASFQYQKWNIVEVSKIFFFLRCTRVIPPDQLTISLEHVSNLVIHFFKLLQWFPVFFHLRAKSLTLSFNNLTSLDLPDHISCCCYCCLKHHLRALLNFSLVVHQMCHVL